MKYVFALSLLISILSCSKDNDNSGPDNSTLEGLIALHSELEQAELIACAGGRTESIFGDPSSENTVFFYPIEGARDFRYYETESVLDSNNFNQYKLKKLPIVPVFNGYLMAFENTPFSGDRMGIVTYRTDDNLHISDPIRHKTQSKPTEVNASLATIPNEGSLNPGFLWQNGEIDENVIFFQVISDMNGNLISGTYTIDTTFTFYILDNVVLNITDIDSNPTLLEGSSYRFTLMGVSEDNWVNLLVTKDFTTL